MSPVEDVFVNAKGILLHWAQGFLQTVALSWVSIGVSIGVLAILAPVIMLYFTWLERKIIARMQNRFGPNRVGLYGLAQPLADGLKMLIKEDIVPRGVDKLLHLAAPIIAVVPAILLFAVIPFGRGMQAADLNVGLLYVFAVSSISSYAIFMGGWASHSKFSLVGAMRAVAQIISYEVPGVLSVVAVIMIAGTLRLSEIVAAQRGNWFVFTPWGLMGFAVFFLSGVAEVNRTPFDMPEAESEIVAGFHTEYSGMKFGLWYMAEFLESFAICAFAATFFLGGWDGPFLPCWIIMGLGVLVLVTAKQLPLPVKLVGVLIMLLAGLRWGFEAIPSWLWFLIKTYILVFVMIWLRGTFPRLRVDQLMGLAWKFLLPLALVNIIAAGVWWSLGGTFAGWAISAFILIASCWVLVRLNKPALLQPRAYILAD